MRYMSIKRGRVNEVDMALVKGKLGHLWEGIGRERE